MSINTIRNSFAHKIFYKINFEQAFELANLAHRAGVDFSDETIFHTYDLSKEWYGVQGIIYEVIFYTFAELVWQNEDIFSKSEISDYLG